MASLQNLYNVSKKKVWDEVDFLYADKHQDFVQVDFNILGIKVSYKVIISLLLGLIKLSQSTQSNKLAIPLQYLKEWTCSFADKHQSSYKLALFFLMEVVRLVESAQNRMLVIILQYLKKKLSLLLLFKWLQWYSNPQPASLWQTLKHLTKLLLCSIVTQNIQLGVQSCLLLLVLNILTISFSIS